MVVVFLLPRSIRLMRKDERQDAVIMWTIQNKPDTLEGDETLNGNNFKGTRARKDGSET